VTPQHKPWRDTLPVHPAADLFPLMSEKELRELGEDIMRHGLKVPIVVHQPLNEKPMLLDGRNRLDAMEAAGLHENIAKALQSAERTATADPFALVASLNINRRHLDAEGKREVIAKLLAAQPDKSDRAVGKMVGADGKTVAAVRTEMEATAEIPQSETRTGADGKSRKKPKRRAKPLETTTPPASDPMAEPSAPDVEPSAAEVSALETPEPDNGNTASAEAPEPQQPDGAVLLPAHVTVSLSALLNLGGARAIWAAVEPLKGAKRKKLEGLILRSHQVLVDLKSRVSEGEI
jgi:ParB-like chromosome segregation protein Spo0J